MTIGHAAVYVRDLEGARQAISRHIHNGQKYIEEKR